MLGSYPPQEAPQEVIWPRHGWEEAPSGMLARGSYKSTIKFIDDDDVTHLQFDYGFSIKKDWGKSGDKEYVVSLFGALFSPLLLLPRHSAPALHSDLPYLLFFVPARSKLHLLNSARAQLSNFAPTFLRAQCMDSPSVKHNVLPHLRKLLRYVVCSKGPWYPDF